MAQNSQFAFRFGLQEGIDPRQVPPGTLVTAENARWTKSGRIEKRNGTIGLPSAVLGGGGLSGCKRLLTRGTELALTDGANLYSFNTAVYRWRKVDQVPNVGLTWTNLVDTNKGVSASDLAVSATGVRVYAWVTGDASFGSMTTGDLFVASMASDGALLTPVTQIGTSANPSFGVRVVAIGANAFVIARVGANITVASVDLTTGIVNAQQSLRTDASAQGFDACTIGNNLVICYENAAHTLKLYSYSYAAPATYTQQAGGGITGETGSGFQAISIDGAVGGGIFVAYARVSIGDMRVAQANDSTLAQTVAPVTVSSTAQPTNCGVVRVSSSSCIVAGSFQVSPGGRVESYLVTGGLVDSASERGTCGSRMVSRPFMLDGRFYMVLVDYPTSAVTGGAPFTGTNTALVEIEATTKGSVGSYVPHRYVGKIDELLGGQATLGVLTGVAKVSATEALLPVPFLAAVPTTVSNWRCGLRAVSVTVGASTPPDLWRSVTYGQETYVAGSVLSTYDGQLCFDYGFARAPYLYSVFATTGGSIAAGNYIWTVLAEYRSAAGVLHRSMTSVSPPTAVAATGKAFVNSVHPTLQSKEDLANGGLTSNASPISIVTYRSTMNGTSLHRETYEPLYNVTLEDPLVQTTVFTDTNTDSNIGGNVDLATRPLLYTTGGILDDEQPPAVTTMVLHKSRLWCVDGSRRQIWFSKSFLDDYGTAPGFSADFRIQFDTPITALATMDDKLVVFGAEQIWYVVGDGPAPNGDGNDLSSPIVVQSDVGCINPRSVVSTPDGVMFQSRRGIYLLTRGLELVWVGRAVKDQLAVYPNITSAVLVAERNEIRFTTNDIWATAGIVLVFNYVEKQWSTAKYTGGGAGQGTPIADAVMWNGAWTFATPDGYVYCENANTWLDDGAWVTMTLETAWISAAGPLAYHSVNSFQAEGVSNSSHELTISVFTDGVTNIARQAKSFQAGTPAVKVGPLEQFEITIGPWRRCQHIRFRVQDGAPGADPSTYGTGQGPAFDTMGIEFRVLRGFAVNPATKKG